MPRLMRPDFSARHSPRLTNGNEVLTRRRPRAWASGRCRWLPSGVTTGLEPAEASIQCVTCQAGHKDQALQHLDCCVRRTHAPLRHVVGGDLDRASQPGYSLHRWQASRINLVAGGPCNWAAWMLPPVARDANPCRCGRSAPSTRHRPGCASSQGTVCSMVCFLLTETACWRNLSRFSPG
jgi:hypothetical protein